MDVLRLLLPLKVLFTPSLKILFPYTKNTIVTINKSIAFIFLSIKFILSKDNIEIVNTINKIIPSRIKTNLDFLLSTLVSSIPRDVRPDSITLSST